MKSRCVIPFFIPHEGCPFSCIFCSQKKITGRGACPSASSIIRTIKERIVSSPRGISRREVAFFGGSFTAIPERRQEEYLRAVAPFLRRGSVDSIRISTRPDFIDDGRLRLLQSYGVRTIELGVQSLSDAVLERSGRGHTAGDVRRASELIVRRGFKLGHQLMVGLPGSTPAIEEMTARSSCRLGADEARIYPVLVIRGTALERMWRRGRYRPLGDRAAVRRSARLVDIFTAKGVKVLRVGLHPSRDLLSGEAVLAGPFHEAFGQMVDTYRCGLLIRAFLRARGPDDVARIRFNPADAGVVIGHARRNAGMVETALRRRNVFIFDGSVPEGRIVAESASGVRRSIGRFR